MSLNLIKQILLVLRKTEKDPEGLDRIFAEKEKKSKYPVSSLI